MEVTNKSYRIKANVNNDTNINLNLNQDYDTFEILSLKVGTQGMYKLHNANYGVVVGRVLANQGFGVPNAKISIFIGAEFNDEVSNQMMTIYPFTSTSDVNYTGKKYNLLPDDEADECHQVVGTFPNKTFLLDNNSMIEVFDKYYKYTTRTNNSGDYIICGVPTGNQILHMDLDLSDCGILSQRPRDMVYKGYTIEQFENPNQFKISDDLNSLSQIISQDQPVNVIPFWGNEDNGETIGITRADINISYMFDPTCVFMGSIVGDNQSNGISKKCIPTEQMGAMDELVTGEGTIEMIRKTPSGDIEEFQIKGTQLIDGNGVWCYQIPMNLDYVMTDEYGNMVATDDPSKGIPTRTQVRFRISMQETEQSLDNYFRAKVLVPHNPKNEDEIDYNFGTKTKDSSFRDLFWNNVYTVKSYIPRFQKSQRWKNERFSGIKHCNIYGNNNPIPYNSLRIKLPFMFIILCALIKGLIKIITFVNRTQGALIRMIHIVDVFKSENDIVTGRNMKCTYIGDGMCPDLDGWYFAPGCSKGIKDGGAKENLFKQTLRSALKTDGNDSDGYASTDYIDETSVDYNNHDNEKVIACLTSNIDYFVSCIEMNLAQEYKVIQFDFYNDWINGMIYMPRWMRQITKKRSYLFGLIRIKGKTKGCFNDISRFGTGRYYTQQCALEYVLDENKTYSRVNTKLGCDNKKQQCHKKKGMAMQSIFGKNGGIVNEIKTSKEQFVYYFKPSEWLNNNKKSKVNLFANDLVLLGTLNNCNDQGIPQAFSYLTNSSYKLPTNLALTNMDDMSYLYAIQDNTVCNNISSSNLNYIESGIKQLNPSFENTYKYGNVSNSNSDLYYMSLDDVVPTTEAAGIAWNYTGPGQGVADKAKGYQPGGHFLGLSCTNSETNIKSCINLQRVCEMGVNISQRREYFKELKSNGDEIDYTMAYHIPTGFIGKDEIVGSDFRSMFATLNSKRLIADAYDDKTGYPIYGFMYSRPNNFNGGYRKYVYELSSYYNMNTNGIENGTIDEWEKIGVREKPIDYDPKEVLNTSTRTIEDGSLDYYLFRMGLTLDNYTKEQGSRFLKNNGGGVSMPQYENSYYFYFGLKDGATALDEFMKQFFSNCNDGRRRGAIPTISTVGLIDKCVMKGEISVSLNNLKLPYNYTLSLGNSIIRKGTESNDKFIITDLEFGDYTLSIVDDDTNTVIDNIKIGIGAFTLDVENVGFKFKTNNIDNYNDVINAALTNNSGYIKISRYLTFDGETIDLLDDTNRTSILLISDEKEENYVIGPYNGEIPSSWTNNNPLRNKNKLDFKYKLDGNFINVYVWEPNIKYNIYIGYKCNNLNANYAKYYNINVTGNGGLDLYMGNRLLSYNNLLNAYGKEWWKDTNNEIWDNNSENGWLLRHYTFKQTINDNETHDSQVYGVSLENNNFSEILFGQAEKENEINDVVTNDMIYDAFIGYTLDDRSTVIPTFGPETITKGRKPYGKIIIDEKGNILGEALETIKLENIVNNGDKCTITYSGSSDMLMEGHGCAIQFQDNTVVYPIVNSSTMTFKKEDILMNYTNDTLIGALVYPLFFYPVIYKPFYNELNVIEYAKKEIILSVESDNVLLPDYVYRTKYTSNGVLHNGVTFNSLFNDCKINDIDIDIKVSQKDMYYNGEDFERITKYKGANNLLNNDEYDVSNYYFNIKEGYPENIINNEEFKNTITLTEIEGNASSPVFYDFISYYRDNNGKCIFVGNPNTISNSEAKYYIIPLKNHKPFYGVTPLSIYNTDMDESYYAGVFNGKTGYNKEGEDVILTVQFIMKISKVTFPIKNKDGIYVSTGFTCGYYWGDEAALVKDMEEHLSEFGINLLYTKNINTNDCDANEYYELIKQGTPITINENKKYDFNSETSTVVGFKEEIIEDGKNVIRIIRMYPDMVKDY